LMASTISAEAVSAWLPQLGGESGRLSVILVSMPFMSVVRPSIQLGLLKAVVSQAGFPVSCFEFGLDLAQRIGASSYERICAAGRSFVGDWLFSVAAFGDQAPDAEDSFVNRYADDIIKSSRAGSVSAAELIRMRRLVIPDFVQSLLDLAPWDDCTVVGFTSTFQQNVASFALARLLKGRFPRLRTVFGGANFDGVMGREWVRSIPWIDYAVQGEGEITFPELLRALEHGMDPVNVAGVVSQANLACFVPREINRNLDSLPTPDYSDYFQRIEDLQLLSRAPRRHVRLPFESSRGCWWGQKHHCTFCGLNGSSMSFRSKSPKRVLDELSTLSQRFRSFHFEAVDNIFDYTYFERLLPELATNDITFDLFFEIKSNLTRRQIRQIREAGINRVQPGIESLSTNVLRLMKKGVTRLQNVNTLRWSRYYGVAVSWNLIYGFPGEILEDYREQLEVIRAIRHLQPPSGAGRIWIERFSPLFTDRSGISSSGLSPQSSYRLIYPATVNLYDAAYFFDADLADTLPDEVFEETHKEVIGWRSAWEPELRPTLVYYAARDFVQIEDKRDPASPSTHTFTGPLATLYLALIERPRTVSALRQALQMPWSEGEIASALDEFCARKMMLRDDQLYLSLALPAVEQR
jgi:ribosomal peptide maturation radical SAM protein 1